MRELFEKEGDPGARLFGAQGLPAGQVLAVDENSCKQRSNAR